MDVRAKVIVNSIEVSLQGKGSVTASCSFKVGNMPMTLNHIQRVTVPITNELRKYIEDIVTAQVGEIISKEEE